MTYSQVFAAPIPQQMSDDHNPASELDERMDKSNMNSPHKVKYESTADGDVRSFVVELDDEAKRERLNRTDAFRDGPIHEPRQRSGMANNGATHTRDLSAHFFDATRLTDALEGEVPGNSFQYQHNRPNLSHPEGHVTYMNAGGPPPISPAGNTGQKHRRGYSGDVSNPVVAHRRINSIGNSAPVDRNYAYYAGHGGAFQPPALRPSYGHRREDSSGLDILSAVANVSKEELAMAAGRPTPTVTWDNPPEPRRPTEVLRMSPSAVSAASYDYPRGPPQNHSYHPGYPPPANIGPYQHAPPHPYHAFYPPDGPPQYHQRVPNASPYPTQYAPARGTDHYSKPSYAPQQPIMTKSQMGEGSRRVFDERIDTDERLFDHQQGHGWNDNQNTGTTQGGTNLTNPPTVGHHRKLSSYSSISTLMNSALFPEPGEAPISQAAEKKVSGHHRATSSSVSFLHGLEDAGDLFLHNLGAAQGVAYQATFSPPSTKKTVASQPLETKSSVAVVSTNQGSGKLLAEGGTSKRVRRKCTADNCPNRVVQGGLCISHGAKRKICNHPGCFKNVKKAGLCSTHGPARRRCDVGGCGKVAVQGGRCIAHGAKKKICEKEGCCKQAILSGMCKKHHDLSQGIASDRGIGEEGGDDDDDDGEEDEERTCDDISTKPPTSKVSSHRRGLSIFQEISAESVHTLLSHDEEMGGMHPLM